MPINDAAAQKKLGDWTVQDYIGRSGSNEPSVTEYKPSLVDQIKWIQIVYESYGKNKTLRIQFKSEEIGDNITETLMEGLENKRYSNVHRIKEFEFKQFNNLGKPFALSLNKLTKIAGVDEEVVRSIQKNLGFEWLISKQRDEGMSLDSKQKELDPAASQSDSAQLTESTQLPTEPAESELRQSTEPARPEFVEPVQSDLRQSAEPAGPEFVELVQSDAEPAESDLRQSAEPAAGPEFVEPAESDLRQSAELDRPKQKQSCWMKFFSCLCGGSDRYEVLDDAENNHEIGNGPKT